MSHQRALLGAGPMQLGRLALVFALLPGRVAAAPAGPSSVQKTGLLAEHPAVQNDPLPLVYPLRTRRGVTAVIPRLGSGASVVLPELPAASVSPTKRTTSSTGTSSSIQERPHCYVEASKRIIRSLQIVCSLTLFNVFSIS